MPAVSDLSTRVGPYEVLETAHVGAFSLVYRCRGGGVPGEVAVKAVRPDGVDPELARCYAVREARLRARFRHRHLLPLLRLDDGEAGPLLAGPWLGRFAPSPASALEVADGVGSALDALHAGGWYHGDVSPGNLLRDPASGRFVLADLGNARRIGARAVRRGAVVATPQVTAPETWSGDRVDGRADLYGLAALLYHALTGSWPFEAEDPQDFAKLHLHAEVPEPGTVGPKTAEVLRTALAKRPGGRYRTGRELAAALRDAVHADGLGRLDRFAAGLGERERAALGALLARSATVDAQAGEHAEQLALQVLGPAAALVALEESGAAAALAAGHETPEAVAGAAGAPERPIRLVLEALAAAGVLARDGGRYRLPPTLAALYADRPDARPLADAAAFWASLPAWAATGEPPARIDSEDGAAYAAAAGRSGVLAGPAAREVAARLAAASLLPSPADVLDVGAGSGVWGLELARAAPGSTITALDRPRVLEQARRHAAAAGLGGRFRAVAGDWRDAALEPEAFDLAVLANVCHVEPPEGVRSLLGRVHAALRAGGLVVVVDSMPDTRAADLGAALQALHLALRTLGGGVHERADYEQWLHRAGFAPEATLSLESTQGALTALVARRR
jgi:SAM-dependent methyltransferase